MKKENWKTKEEKRKLRKKEDNGIKDLLRIVRHLFKNLHGSELWLILLRAVMLFLMLFLLGKL